MDISLKDKVAIITGGTRGIGFAMVKKFVEAQAKVVIWGSRIETAEAALAKLREAFPDCEAMAMAPVLTNQKQVKEAMALVANKYGRIDILANNAGISQSIPLENYTDEDLDKIIDLNIRAVFVCSKAAAAHMKETGGGCIINTSSIVSVYGQGLGCMYPASKSAVNGLTRSLSRELGRYGIRVNAVAPGVTRTDMVAALPENMVLPLLQKIPLGRMGEADDIANAALFLASDLASYITGAVLPVDGGAII
jgi:3-oxoacyl-[acyl-carrier protein] reductase/7-alpha-hydroxysteroid dehydrogenase